MSTSRPKLKTAFKKSRVIAPLYTGGPVAISTDGDKLLTSVGEEAILTEVQSGTELCRLAGDTENITALCLSSSSAHAILFTSSLSLRIYEIFAISAPAVKPLQSSRIVPRAHDAPVLVCRTDPTSTYLASGSADGVVKVWDILRGYVTHAFKGHGGIVSALAFDYPLDPGSVAAPRMRLITASVDTRVRIFDLTAARTGGGAGKPEAILEGHASVPRGLDVSKDGRWLISGGRDSVVLVWDLKAQGGPQSLDKKGKGKGKETQRLPTLVRTIPVMERVEALGFLQYEDNVLGYPSATPALRFFTAGQKGAVKVWDMQQASVLFALGDEQAEISDEQEEQRQIVDAFYVPALSTVVTVHADQNILFHSVSAKSLTRQLVGFNDEIVDATFLTLAGTSKDTHVALATNSSLIRVYSASSLDARLLEGHTDIVLSLDHGPDHSVLASGSKDHSARLWAPFSEDLSVDGIWGWGCVAVCDGHAESIGAVALSRRSTDSSRPAFLFTGSQDRTIKMWDLTDMPTTHTGATPLKCKSLTTHKAHDKDINALDVSPDDRLLASGSQDRTARIYAIEQREIKLLGTCTGHKRGVWTVRFSRSERVLATGSGDRTVRMWSLDDFSCVRTFEGHTNAVLRIDFVSKGMQILSSASDGLVKLWNVKDEECVATMDNHEDKVWALAVSSDERTIVSGAADSVVTFWEDCTEEQEQERESKRTEMVLKEQDLSNFLAVHDYRNAISLALALERPGRLYALFKDVRVASEDVAGSSDSTSSITGHPAVDEVVRTLPGSELVRLLRYVRDWNVRASTSAVAQGVLHAVVKLWKAEAVLRAFEENGGGGTEVKEVLEALVAYTERHRARMERLVQESYVLDFVLGEMDGGLLNGNDSAQRSVAERRSQRESRLDGDSMDTDDDGEWEEWGGIGAMDVEVAV